MTVVISYSQTIWPYLREHIDFLISRRKRLKRSDKKVRIGINLSIILMAACYIEGKLESDIKELVKHRRGVLREINVKKFYHRRIYNTFLNNIEKLLTARIERTTGIENFQTVYGLLSYRNTPLKFQAYPNWEGIKVLFNLRNVLAHGREVTAERISGFWLDVDWKDEFMGGYKIAEAYLYKKKLTTIKFIKKGSIDHLFTNKIADHFYSISKNFLKYHSKIIDQEKKKFDIMDMEAFRLAVKGLADGSVKKRLMDAVISKDKDNSDV